MINLNLLRFKPALRLEKRRDQTVIWDPIRRRWISSGPEEMVRQLLLLYFIEEMKYPDRLIQVEKVLQVHQRRRRFDILLYDRSLKPHLLVECKRPELEIDQDTFDQISRYNIALQVPYMLVSNGRSNHCCIIDYQLKTYQFLNEIPVLSS